MIATRPEQRVSIAAKMKESYYINNMAFYIGTAVNSNNKIATSENMEAANGIVPDSVYSYVLTPLSGEDSKKLPGSIRDTDFITPIREKNIGEYIELPREFTVKVDDPNVTLLKNADVAKILKPVIEQAIINAINKEQPEGQDSGVPSTSNVDVKEIADKALEEWIDERADNALQLVKAVNNDNDLESFILTAFNYWWGTEEVYIYLYIQNGGIFYEIINPMDGFTVDNGNDNVQDHEAFLIRRKLTIDRINDYYRDDLSKKDREYIDYLINNTNDGVYAIPVEVYQGIYGRKLLGDDNYEGNINFSTSGAVTEHILFYKTEVKRDILIYTNELNEIQTKVIDEKEFEFNPELGHLALEKEWITETWKQVLIGDEESGIYLKPKPVDVQIYDERGANKLPIYGKKGILRGIDINPIPKRIIPNLALHRIITLQIERQIAKFKGAIELIPQGMLKSGINASTKAAMFYRLADNTIIYDETKIDSTTSQGYRIVGNDTVSNYIKTLIEFRDIIKAEAWDMANMNDGRYGNAAPSSTVTNNQQNIFNAKLGSVLSITTFNNILVKLYEAILAYAEHAYPNGRSGSLFNGDGTVAYYNMDSDTLTASKFGIHMTNSVIDGEKLKEYKSFAFAAGQHGEFQLATSALEGDSISGIRTNLNKYIKDKDEYEKQLEQDKVSLEGRIHDEQMADKQKDRDAKTSDIQLKEDLITEREVKKAAVESDSNSNNVASK